MNLEPKEPIGVDINSYHVETVFYHLNGLVYGKFVNLMADNNDYNLLLMKYSKYINNISMMKVLEIMNKSIVFNADILNCMAADIAGFIHKCYMNGYIPYATTEFVCEGIKK